MPQTLKQRQQLYERAYDLNIIPRLPIIIKLDGWNFSKVTKSVDKPFCNKTSALFTGTMVALVKQIENVVFGYQYLDKIVLVLKNNNPNYDPWFNNSIQDLVSVASGLATDAFRTNHLNMEDPPDLYGSFVFRTHAFALPDINETINYLISEQISCYQSAVTNAALSKVPASDLHDKNIEDRKNVLAEFGINFDKFYETKYIHGTGVYLTPSLIKTAQGQETKQKWLLDFDLVPFVDNKQFLNTILNTGSDIFRPERDL
jgi:tRNA(His) 5'-end guanylyltransferase